MKKDTLRFPLYILFVLMPVLTALVIAVLTYRRQKKLAEQINRELGQRSC